MAPSPLTNRMRNLSQAPPQPETPVVFQEAGHVFPYRGTESHGVDPDMARQTVDPEEADYGTTVAVPMVPEKKIPDPVPVYVVTGPNDRDVIKDWDIVREMARAGDPSRMILSRDVTRSNTTIVNTHATDTLYISPNPVSDTNMMYPIGPGQSYPLGGAQTEVWARAKDGLATDGTHDITIVVSLNREVDVPK